MTTPQHTEFKIADPDNPQWKKAEAKRRRRRYRNIKKALKR